MGSGAEQLSPEDDGALYIVKRLNLKRVDSVIHGIGQRMASRLARQVDQVEVYQAPIRLRYHPGNSGQAE